MLGIPKTTVWVIGVALALSLFAAPAVATDEDYTEDVEILETALDDIVQKHGDGENVSGELKTFIQEDWENVEYHEAIETTNIRAYGAIWTEINELRNTVESDIPTTDVADQAENVKTALRNGLDALEGDTGGDHSSHAHGSEVPEGGDSIEATVDRIRADLDYAAAEYAAGESDEAKEVIGETYLSNFEGLEGELIEKDPDLVTELEIDFNAGLPGLISQGASDDEVRAKVDEMNTKLDRVEQLIGGEAGDSQVFGARNTDDTSDVKAPGPGVAVAIAAFAAALIAGRRFR